MLAAIYARKSSDQPGVADEAKSVARQVEGGRAFIAKQGWTLDEAHVYTDDGVSGFLTLGRPGFQRMLRDAAAGAFGAVVFYDLDRFGRNSRRTMEALHDLADLSVTVWDYSTGLRVDLESWGGVTTYLKAQAAEEYRAQIRKHTRDALRRQAEAGYVAGARVYGYDNVGPAKAKVRHINEAEAAVVRDIFKRFADGASPAAIATALNRAGTPTPRAGPGWSVSSVRGILERRMYRGEYIYGRRAMAYGRELPKEKRKTLSGEKREKGLVMQPESTWVQLPAPALIDPDLIARVDARLTARRERYFASLARTDGKRPERAHGKYLLSGGMLICSVCGGNFEARKYPLKGKIGDIYMCSTRRRRPGMCTNTLALPIRATDESILKVIEGEVLGTRLIEQLLSLLDEGPVDDSKRLEAERDALRKRIDNLLEAIADGVPAATVAPKIKEYEAEVARIEAQLRKPRPVPIDRERLRAALEQRAAAWKADLRGEPKIARLLLRRLIGPLTLEDDSKRPEFVPAGHQGTLPKHLRWEAEPKADGLLEGLVHVDRKPR